MVDKGKEAAANLVENVINTVKELPGKMLEIGKNIVQGIWNGISGAIGWLWDKISGFVGGIVDGIKNVLGIHSPSTVLEKQVGKNMALGVGEGFINNLDRVYKQMRTAVDFQTQKLSANLSTTANVNRSLYANISMQSGDVYLSERKVGRIVTPGVTRTFKLGGAY